MDIDLIVKQCQAGDREAFGTLYRAYLMQMHKVVAHYVNDKDAVWDILHDGFIIAFQAIGSMKNTSKLKSWLTSIMKNLALQYIREESSHKSITLSEITSIYESDDNQVGQNLTWAELDSIIGKLPDSYSKIFKLSVLDGLSHKEIGELLGIAPHSSSSQLARAKAMLRRW
ncbi:MAG: sigma-70 family RNA polymerase sigma factor, partial [Muribaculaceae bacterium]|nr:sigma-70 family RNA polymerase sigma factor [Muribaculaceae bacterium]